jgi:hypothetical protein
MYRYCAKEDDGSTEELITHLKNIHRPCQPYSLSAISMLFANATSPWANKNCIMSVKKIGGQIASGLVFFGVQVELAFGAITR